jgi:hypothetical protein
MLTTLSDGLAKLDDMFSPLSSRSITDYQEHLTFAQPPDPSKTSRNKFEQQTRNTYYDQFESERLLQKARREETERERTK